MKNLLLILGSFLMAFHVMHAQANRLHQFVEAHESTPQKIDLIATAKSLDVSKEQERIISEGMVLRVNPKSLHYLVQAQPQSITVQLPIDETKTVELKLIRKKVLADGFVLATDKSDNITYTPEGVSYRGVVAGDEKSIAAVTFFNDDIIAVISTTEDGNINFGKRYGRSANEYIVYKESAHLNPPGFNCYADDLMANYEAPAPQEQRAAGPENCVRVYFECDYGLFQEKGSVENATNYMIGVFNVVAVLYTNESINTEISEIFVWTTADTYSTTSAGDALDQFRAARPNYNGDLAHLVTRTGPGGGLAWVGGLCNSYGYAYSNIGSSYATFPNYSWTVSVVTHEMGHNLGSTHTHSCAWNGNNTQIDDCGNQYLDQSGQTPGACYDSASPIIPAAGTIMSYCHLTNGVGIDFNLGFGTQPGDVIRNQVYNASCLGVCSACPIIVATASDVDCFGNLGSISLNIAGGTFPYTYIWSNGSTDADLTNLTPGTYTVTVTESDGCSETATATVNDNSAGLPVSLTLVLDNYPAETSWQVSDGGNILASGSGYGVQGATVTESFCLPEGCYDFIINDSYGDGICCGYGNGSYSLADGDSNVLASGGQFTTTETTNFCLTNPLACPESITLENGTDNFTSNEQQTFQADLFIEAANEIANGCDIEFKASDSVLLEAGFSVEQGAVFTVTMEGCAQ